MGLFSYSKYIILISKIHHINGIIKQFYHDNLLRYEKQIGLHGYKEYIESIKKGMIIFDGI